jgi:hypothetical protein
MASGERIDLSFLRYVERRKNAAAAEAREGAAYAFGAELRFRARLARLRPVVMVTEGALQQFKTTARARLLDGAVATSPHRFGALHAMLERSAKTLGISLPAGFVAPGLGVRDACAFGTSDEAMIVIPTVMTDALSERELFAAVAGSCGRIHNGQAPLLTTLWVMETSERAVLRWAARPAVLALSGWAARAAITADRASMLVTRDFEAVAGAIVRVVGGQRGLLSELDPAACVRALADGTFPEAAGVDPDAWRVIRRRLAACKAFETTTYYRAGSQGPPPPLPAGVAALSMEACDVRVAALFADKALE